VGVATFTLTTAQQRSLNLPPMKRQQRVREAHCPAEAIWLDEQSLMVSHLDTGSVSPEKLWVQGQYLTRAGIREKNWILKFCAGSWKGNYFAREAANSLQRGQLKNTQSEVEERGLNF
jgi:hypothetical protein